jgi:competence protein ComEA
MAAVPPRPAPSPRFLEGPLANLRAWLRWFGPGRIALAAAGTVITVVGGLWLIFTPDPPAISQEVSAAARGYEAVTPTDYTLILAPTLQPATSEDFGSSPEQEMVFVHVVGAVAQPGVYTLSSRSRVIDALDAAGGPTDVAQVDAMNLAALVSDGQRLVVPTTDDVRAGRYQVPVTSLSPRPGSPASGSSTANAGSRSTGEGPIDINSAGLEELTALPGVGPAIAAAIVEDRNKRGPFASVDDLLRVRGIGPAKLEALRSRART